MLSRQESERFDLSFGLGAKPRSADSLDADWDNSECLNLNRHAGELFGRDTGLASTVHLSVAERGNADDSRSIAARPTATRGCKLNRRCLNTLFESAAEHRLAVPTFVALLDHFSVSYHSASAEI